ncbi:2-oxoacid:acceptor oxidoreductase family protein [Candidatus Bathyarchaeota archaeon]|nr:2-oxoacid:acceptor oxidoreductase family protein [Candidatus Bathyarchaeota archaeon]
MLVEIRWHGRAGQGIITVSRLLAFAAIVEGKHAQAFPEFGPERLGSAMTGYTRISDEPIEIHSPIYEPDIVGIVDSTLIGFVNVHEGVKNGGKIVLNSFKPISEGFLKELTQRNIKAFKVNATKISLNVLGNDKAANTATLGALIKAASLVSLNSINKVLEERFKGPVLEKNIEILKKGYEEVEEI